MGNTNKMLTIPLVIILVNLKIIAGAETSDDKIINSLPEDQKREFLQKVEERIKNEVPEVKSPARNDTNVNIYEQQLQNQGKSIQNILRSEIDSLQRRSSNKTLANRRSNLKEDDDTHIDLTLRNGKSKTEAEIKGERKPLKTVLFDNKNQESNIIPVVVQYDSEINNPEKGSSNLPKVVKDAEVKKTNEITWINSTSKSLNISNSPVGISKPSKRINYIDVTLPKPDIVTLKLTNLNNSADVADGPTTDKVNASTYHESSDTTPVAVKTSEEVINLNMKPNNDNSATENIVASTENLHGTLQQNEKDNGIKGNTILATDDDVNYTTQGYVNSQQNYADISTTINYSFTETIDESSNLTLDNVYAVPDIVVHSTAKYDVDAYLTNGNKTAQHIDTQNVGNITTQNGVDKSTMLDEVDATVHVLNSSSTLDNNDTATNDMYSSATLDDDSTTIISVDNSTLEKNNLLLNNKSGSLKNAVKNTPEININLINNTARHNITTLADSTKGNIIAFKSIYVPKDAGNVETNSDYLATTKTFQKNFSNDIIRSTIMNNLFGSLLQSKTPQSDKDDTDKKYIASVTTNNIVSSTIVGDTNAETDEYYPTTTANYVNGLTDSLYSSKKIGNENVLNDTIDKNGALNTIKEITTDNLVSVTKLGYIYPDGHDEYHSTTVKSLYTETGIPFGSTILGDVSAEKYGQQSTPTVTLNEVTESIAGSTKLDNVNPDKNIIMNVMGTTNQAPTLKGSTRSFKIPDYSNINFDHNKIHKKSKPNTNHKTNNIELSKNMFENNISQHQKNMSEHFALSIKEDENTYRVYEVGLKKEISDPKPNKDIGSHPHYVRVYNYDPKNAYFNADDHQNSSGNNPIIVKETETRSKSTKLDIHITSPGTTSNPSIQKKDVKDTTSNDTRDDIVNVAELIFGNDNSASLNRKVKADEAKVSEDNTQFEKALKQGLNKIRQILFNIKNRGAEKERKDYLSNKYSHQPEVENKYKNYKVTLNELQNKHTSQLDAEKHATGGLTEAINEIVAHVKKIVDQTENPGTSTFYNKKYYMDDSRNVGNPINSFTNSQNPDIQLIIETLQNIEDNNQKQINAKSRFKIKDRDGKHLKKDLSSSNQDNSYDDNYKPMYVPVVIPFKANEFEESKRIILEDKYLELHVNTLKQFVGKDDVALKVYDWLGTTVLIQAGIEKLQHLVDITLNHKRLHPLDRQLLDFVIDLHLTAEAVTENYKEDIASNRRQSFVKPLPIKDKSHKTLRRMLEDIKKGKTRKRSGHDVNDLEEFLEYLKRSLNDLHTAVKQISTVTKYRSQHWFRDIKHLYLKSAGAKEYLELLLHITTARLIGLLDDSAKVITAEDEDFVRKNRASIERIGVEFVMVLRICKEMDKL